MIRIGRIFSLKKLLSWLLAFGGLWLIGGTAYNWSLWPFAGIFGDIGNLENVFSPVNALFSAIASGGAIYAILLQLEIIKEQQRVVQEQQVEDLFYNMLMIHRDNRDKVQAVCIKLDEHEARIENECLGLTAFKALHDRLEAMVTYYYCEESERKNKQYMPKALCNELDYIPIACDDPIEAFRFIYKFFTEATNHCLSQYFTHFYHVVKFIDEHVTDEAERKKYFSFIRAQLSPYEYTLFYYNGLANDDYKDGKEISKVRYLIEKNCLLHTMNLSLRFDDERVGVYADSAFDH